VQIGNSHHNYSWHEKWIQSPNTESAREGWAHHGIVVSNKTGNIITFHQGEPKVLIYSEYGELIDSWDTNLQNAHGMTLVEEGSDEFLWMSDNLSGKVIKVSVQGEETMAINKPDISLYDANQKYSPTDVKVFQEVNGGTDQIIVADGYGSSLINFYDKNGNYEGTITGEEGEGGHFATPHGLWIDTRKTEPELYIADRSNSQIQVYSPTGIFKRNFGSGPGANWLHSPSGFASWDQYLIVAELRGSRITMLDIDDKPVAYLGENTGAFKLNSGWPNVPHSTLIPGKFSSPHGIATDKNGNIFVAEWLIGGRINKLTRTS
jgi:hypothetical protein